MSIVLLNNYSQVSLHSVFLKSVIRNSQFNTTQIELGWVNSGLANFRLNKNSFYSIIIIFNRYNRIKILYPFHDDY